MIFRTPRTWTISGVILSLFVIGFLSMYKRAGPSNPQPTKCEIHNLAPVDTPKPTSKRDTILLLWFWPSGSKFNLKSCASNYQIHNCFLTDNRSLYSKADGVLFHHVKIAQDMSNLPTEPRPFFQKWIWMLFESPWNTKRIEGLDNLFNITMSYRRDADISIREQMELVDNQIEKAIQLAEKNKLVCWIVSKWRLNFARCQYYEELQKHIVIDTYGRYFNKTITRDDYFKVIESCKFYLSFENSHERSDRFTMDYITEKLYTPLRLGTVPVVLGPPRSSYEKFVPSDAFIHVDDFGSPKELADYLHMLDKNDEKYRQFFRWRKHFRIKGVRFPQEHACRACQYIQDNRHFQSFPNLNTWYWG